MPTIHKINLQALQRIVHDLPRQMLSWNRMHHHQEHRIDCIRKRIFGGFSLVMESDEDLRALDEALEAGAIDVVAKGEDDGGSGVGDVDVDE